MKLLKIIPSDVKGKKYSAYFKLDNGKERKVNFGAANFRDFTLLNNKKSPYYIKNSGEREKVKQSYLKRHAKRENWFAPMTAGALSRWILWNKPTLGGSISHFKNKFKL
jgi:hypothetical protein